MNTGSTSPAVQDATTEEPLTREALAAHNAAGVERIVVGVDGSAQSVEALRWAVRIASGIGARVDVVMTWEPRAGMVGPYIATPGRYVSPKDNAETVLEHARHAAYGGDSPPHVTLQARQGDPADVLIEESRTAQLLVIGSRGLGRVAGLLLGSVSARCAAQAHCPVVIMHEPDQS